jgi:CheY-like chemotaxis protein
MKRSFDPNAGEIDVFPQEITRVLRNLISNGFYAATKRKGQPDRDGYEPTLAAATRNLGDRVEIRIRDSGTGIPPEVSDINMPGMTGLELLPKAKAARPDVPVIMITAYGDDSTRRKALEGGADALLTKPIDFVALRGEIDNRVAGAGADVR